MRIKYVPLLAGVAAIAIAAVIAACGGSAESSASGNGADRAFVAGMVPHHEQAIEMAKVAQDKAQSQFVRKLAGDIVVAQGEEIQLMKRTDADLADEGVEVEDLGMTEQMMGMEGEMSDLESARPFDREFIDMMIAHHQGAIRMAQMEIQDGENDQLVALANRIDAAQSAEIHAMNRNRVREFGSASPSGGVPTEGAEHMDGEHGSMEGMG